MCKFQNLIYIKLQNFIFEIDRIYVMLKTYFLFNKNIVLEFSFYFLKEQRFCIFNVKFLMKFQF